MKQILNYVWLANRNYYDPARMASGSPIPAEYLNNALITADENSDLKVCIWVDQDQINEAGRILLSSFRAGHKNVTFRNLGEVAAYRNMIRRPIGPVSLAVGVDNMAQTWRYVDLTRMLVLDHVFRSENPKEAFYSDFDVTEPSLNGKEVRRLMNRFGLVFAKYDRDGLAANKYLENGFMGFDRLYARQIRDKVIPAIAKAYHHGDQNGWLAFCACAGEIARRKQQDIRKMTVEIRTLWKGKKPQFNPSLLVIGQKAPAL